MFVVQLSTLGLVWPSLLLTYLGQASYLIKHPDHIPKAYYSSVPQPFFWPMFVLAVLSAIIASQVYLHPASDTPACAFESSTACQKSDGTPSSPCNHQVSCIVAAVHESCWLCKLHADGGAE